MPLRVPVGRAERNHEQRYAKEASMKYTTSEKLRPPPTWYGDEYERSLDPWHRDAFPSELAHAAPNQATPRKSGWMALDGIGNPIGFFPDGTDVEATPQQIRMMKQDMRDRLMEMGADAAKEFYEKEQP